MRRDIHREIVERVIESLENGVAPWSKPWVAGQGGEFPHNGNSGRRYRGINVLLLWMMPFQDTRWFTYKGAQKAKGQVRRGEKGTDVVLFKMLTKKETNQDGKEVTVKIPFLRSYKVFNAEQIDGLPATVETDETDTINPQVGFEKAQAVVDGNGVAVSHGSSGASYHPRLDRIAMPAAEQFKTVADYWSTMLHEEVHSTGHKSRLDRNFGNRFGSEAYAFEELIAEMGSAFLCTHLQVEGKLQHESYIDNWIKVLKGDKWALWTAAREAENASDYLLKKAGLLDDEKPAAETKVA